MKTIVVFSDSHGFPLPKKLVDVAMESDYVFFLGDGLSGLGDVLLNNGLSRRPSGLRKQLIKATPWLTERHGYDPTSKEAS